MKKINLKLILSLVLMMIVSCDEPETVVTNIVHLDGSVTRKIVMRNTKNKFEKSELQVPFDPTWTVTDSLEISSKGDTTWIKRAEKLFVNVEDINKAYQHDSSVNGKMIRHVRLSKKFRWFNTVYRFSEIVDRQIGSGYAIKNFLNEEELTYFYSPDYIKFNKENGADSVKYKILADSIDKKTENWLLKNIVSLWIEEFTRLVGPKAGPELSVEALKPREDEFAEIIKRDQDDFDSLWSNGVLLRKFIGDEDAIKFKTEADSAVENVIPRFLVDIRDYSLRIVMPGKLIATNGYVDSTRNLLWPVKSDFFITDQYEMRAESKITNIWAWIVSGMFLAFVFAGILLKRKIPSTGWRTGFKP
jgi:hypothetical protein